MLLSYRLFGGAFDGTTVTGVSKYSFQESDLITFHRAGMPDEVYEFKRPDEKPVGYYFRGQQLKQD